MNTNMETSSQQETTYFVKIFIAVFVAISGVLILLHLYIYHGKKKQALQELSNVEVHRATVMAQVLNNHFDFIFGDLNFLVNRYQAASLSAPLTEPLLPGIEQDFLLFSREKKMYDQIRFIDSQGRERLRINYNGGAPYAVPEKELQDVSLRYYFQDCLALEPGKIYVSPLDLNVERGDVELPFKPIIRIGKPLHDSQGQVSGILLLNYYGSLLLSHVGDELAYPYHGQLLGAGQTMLVNTDGYWLVAPDKEDEWGFMFAHRKGRSFAARYPREWSEMHERKSGHLLTTNGFFAFALIQPPAGSFAAHANSFGKIISFVSADRIERIIYRERATFFILVFLLVSLAAAVSLLVALIAVRRKRHEKELVRSAFTDPLTGLLNRRGFQERLELETGRVDRYGGRLFMILADIDCFKKINDTHGHDAGDFILKKLASTLSANLRSSDVVCRWGGEEFMVLVSGYTADDGEKVAEKLRRAVEDEVFSFNEPQLKVTMSFGVCAYRKKMNMEELLKCSDEMLYTSKRNGRNQVTAERL